MEWPPARSRDPRRFSSAEVEEGERWPTPDIARPRTRGECECGPRPCPWLGCRYHLGLDMHACGFAFKLQTTPPWELPATCALDVASIGGISTEDTARFLGITRQRVHQIEQGAMAKLDPESIDLLFEWT
jgi:hypothetical protein